MNFAIREGRPVAGSSFQRAAKTAVSTTPTNTSAPALHLVARANVARQKRTASAANIRPRVTR